MIDNRDSVQLSEYCFNVCEAVKVALEGKNADDLSESIEVALADLERCVDFLGPVCFHLKQLQGHVRN